MCRMSVHDALLKCSLFQMHFTLLDIDLAQNVGTSTVMHIIKQPEDIPNSCLCVSGPASFFVLFSVGLLEFNLCNRIIHVT